MTSAGDRVVVAGFPLALDRRYEPDTHMWVLPLTERLVRIGMDALGVETSGTIAHLSIAEDEDELVRGRPFGQLEAAKFVGPLVSPLSGTISRANPEVIENPGLLERDPYGAGWLIEAATGAGQAVDGSLLSGRDEIIAWFAARIADYRRRGVIAE